MKLRIDDKLKTKSQVGLVGLFNELFFFLVTNELSLNTRKLNKIRKRKAKETRVK